MCDRYYSLYDRQQLTARVHAEVDFDIQPSHSIAPATLQPVVHLNSEGVRKATMMCWGLIPFWSKNVKIAHKTINATAETVATSQAFRNSFKRRRVLVPASGFFGRKTLDGRTKQPYAITVIDEAPLAFAGVAERWRDPATQQDLETYSIITTTSNELTAQIHHRMPVILAPADYERWLDHRDLRRPPIDLLRPFPADKMQMWPVHKDIDDVSRVGTNC
jgi:putative SOS response-associated peptidase YedK